MNGFRVNKTASELTPVPVIAAGGVACLADIKAAIQAGASALSVGAFFCIPCSSQSCSYYLSAV